MKKIVNKNKIVWINFLHLYQPSNSKEYNIKEAIEKSYFRIIRSLEENPDIKFNININGCLLSSMEDLGYDNFISRINKLVKRKQIELTGTACYHPILPLIPEKEVKLQIKENEEILQKHFGKNFKPSGFFLPELAYSAKVAKIVKSMGYKWIILDEIAIDGKIKEHDFNQVYYDKNSGLEVVIRSRKISNNYVPNAINDINQKCSKDFKSSVIITATDGELYGLRYIDQTAIFEKLLKLNNLQTITVSEFIKQNKKSIVSIKPLSHSWATSEKELKMGQYFNLWKEETNKIQKKLWQLANLAHDTVEKYKKDDNYYWARWHLVRGLASCTFWWASAKDFRLFGPISWSPDEIEKGANELIKSIRSINDIASRKIKIKAEKLCILIKKDIWENHWTYYWKK